MEILEYDEVDPLQVLNLTLLALDFPFTPEHAAHIRRTAPRPFPCLTVNAVENEMVLGQVGAVWNVQPEATLRLLTSFYDTGVTDDSSFTYAPMNLNVKLGFPLLAKILLGTGVMIVMGLVMGIRKLMFKRSVHKSH